MMNVSLSKVCQVGLRTRRALPCFKWLRPCDPIFLVVPALCFSAFGAALAEPPVESGKKVDSASGVGYDPGQRGVNTPRSAVADGAEQTSARKRLSFLARLGRFIGKFHVLVIHFPIVLGLEAVLMELLSMWRKEQTPSGVVRFLVFLGAVAAVSAAGLGWFHAAFSGAGPRQILFIHRWVGTLAAIWSVGTFALSELDVRRQRRTNRFRLVLFIGAGLIAMAGHFGGTLVFGQDFFKW